MTGNPDGNWGGFVVVPSEIVRNQLGPETKNEIQSLGNLFSPNAESVGTQMTIGVESLLWHLELLEISWTWMETAEIPFHTFAIRE